MGKGGGGAKLLLNVKLLIK